MKIVLLVAGLACLVAGLWPDWSLASGPDGGATDLRLGLLAPPLFRYHRESFRSANGITMFGEGTRMEANSVSGYRSEWRIHVVSWSAALVVAGVVLLFVSLRRQRHLRVEEPPPSVKMDGP